MSIYQENCEIKPSRISAPGPKSRKYLYVKIMAYTVLWSWLYLIKEWGQVCERIIVGIAINNLDLYIFDYYLVRGF